MERRMRQNYLIYNRQISDSQKSIIGYRSLEIEFTFTEIDTRKSIFTNRSSEIDHRRHLEIDTVWLEIFED